MLLRRKEPGPHDSVVDVSQLITVDKRFFGQRVGPLASKVMQTVESGLRLVLAL